MNEDKNNNKGTETKEYNLLFYCRWWAFCLKHNITDISSGVSFVKSQPIFVQRWIIDGKGTPYANINLDHVKYALQGLYDVKYSPNRILERVVNDRDSQELMLEYCLSMS